MRILLFFAAVLSLTLNAQEKSAFEQAMEHAPQFQTKERVVQYGGSEYREIEYHGSTYYMRFLDRTSGLAELDCSTPNGTPNRVEVGAQVVSRTKAFISFIQETCTQLPQGKTRVNVRLNPTLGITLPNGPKDLLQDKKVWIKPSSTPEFGFSGSF